MLIFHVTLQVREVPIAARAHAIGDTVLNPRFRALLGTAAVFGVFQLFLGVSK